MKMQKLLAFILITLSSYSYCAESITEDLLKAIVHGNLSEVTQLVLKNSIDLNEFQSSVYNTTFLGVAVIKGNLNIVELLLKNGAKLSEDNDFNSINSPIYLYIHLASMYGHLNIVDFLLSKLNPNFNPIHLNEPLASASRSGHKNIAELLVKFGANVNAVTNNTTALILCSEKGHVDTVKLLLENNADVNSTDKNSQTALILAAKNNHPDVILLLLLTNKVDVNRKDIYGKTALDYADNNSVLPEGIKRGTRYTTRYNKAIKIKRMLKYKEIYFSYLALRKKIFQRNTPFPDALIDIVLDYEDLKFSDFYENKKLIDQAIESLRIEEERLKSEIIIQGIQDRVRQDGIDAACAIQ